MFSFYFIGGMGGGVDNAQKRPIIALEKKSTWTKELALSGLLVRTRVMYFYIQNEFPPVWD